LLYPEPLKEVKENTSCSRKTGASAIAIVETPNRLITMRINNVKEFFFMP
jgi:hypothetical protein